MKIPAAKLVLRPGFRLDALVSDKARDVLLDRLGRLYQKAQLDGDEPA